MTGNFQKPIDGEFRPEDNIYASPTEKIGQDKRQLSETALKNDSSKIAFAALFIEWARKTLVTLFHEDSNIEKDLDYSKLLSQLITFRSLFIKLTETDESHNIQFISHLSDEWHKIQNSTTRLPSSQWGKILKQLVHQIHHHPDGADHPLGYYFDEYAGKEWIPFPYMEILQKLHLEQTNGGVLKNWISELNEIIKSLEAFDVYNYTQGD